VPVWTLIKLGYLRKPKHKITFERGQLTPTLKGQKLIRQWLAKRMITDAASASKASVVCE
jgi:hypothetical protein